MSFCDFEKIQIFDGLTYDQRIYPEFDAKLQDMSKARLASYEWHWVTIFILICFS